VVGWEDFSCLCIEYLTTRGIETVPFLVSAMYTKLEGGGNGGNPLLFGMIAISCYDKSKIGLRINAFYLCYIVMLKHKVKNRA